MLRVALLGAAGAMVALCGLLAQSFAYLGWASASRDLQLTFLNRNFYEQISGQAGALNTLEFFLKHRIVYWLDNPDTRGYLGVGHFLYTVAASILPIDTPYLILVVWIPTIAWALRIGLRGRSGIWRSSSLSLCDESLAYGSPQNRAVSRITWGLVLLMMIYAAVSLALGFLVVNLRGFLDPLKPDVVEIPVLGLVGALPERYRLALAHLWLGAIQDSFSDPLLHAGLVGSIVLALIVVLGRGRRYLRMLNDQSGLEVFRYLAAGSAGFVCIYVLSPGYLWAGYLGRYAPLPVFIVDVWIALFFYMLIAIARASWGEIAAALTGFAGIVHKRTPSPAAATQLFVLALSLFLLVLGSAYWAKIQIAYTNILPPTSLQVLRELGQPRYRGSTFISNNYSAPVAYFTGNWAYMDSTVAENIFRFDSGKTMQVIGGEYLWEADRESNAAYLHPQYYICIVSPSLSMAAGLVALPSHGRLSNCSSQPLVRGAQEGVGPFFNVRVASDPTPRDMWAIVKLDPSIQLTRLH